MHSELLSRSLTSTSQNTAHLIRFFLSFFFFKDNCPSTSSYFSKYRCHYIMVLNSIVLFFSPPKKDDRKLTRDVFNASA